MEYVHGYNQRENIRLQDQASTLVELLHADTGYPDGCHVLEAGCGVGAQTVTLARNSPRAHITSIDISDRSIAEAQEKIEKAGYTNVSFEQADIFNLPFKLESFDHNFVCFVLEHLARPVEALLCLRNLLKVGGTITVIEVTMDRPIFILITALRIRRFSARSNYKTEMEAMPILAGNYIRC